MSREIKFRAWDRASVAGRMVKVTSLQFNDWLNVNGTGGADGVHYSLMQFTGLHDKNGVEIYEGDILSGVRDASDDEAVSASANVVVTWFEGNAEFILVDVEEYARGVLDEPAYIAVDEAWDAKSVLGNVHENPDFLA